MSAHRADEGPVKRRLRGAHTLRDLLVVATVEGVAIFVAHLAVDLLTHGGVS